MQAARVGDPIVTGHLCESASTIAGPGAPTVLIEGKPAARVGDLSMSHTTGVPPFCVPHTMPITTGCMTVLIEGSPVAHAGSQIDAGTVTSGAPRVLVCSNPM